MTRDPNLAFIHQETLTSIVRLRSGRQQVTDAQFFRTQICESLKKSLDDARRGGYSDQAIHDCQFALVVFLDETIRELRSPAFTEWVKMPLLPEYFGAPAGAESFSANLDRLMAQPDSSELGDTLEVYLLCLMLGYKGRAAAASPESVRARLRESRNWTVEFSDLWRRPSEAPSKSAGAAGGRGLRLAAVACFVGLLLLFTGYQFALKMGVKELRSPVSSGDVR